MKTKTLNVVFFILCLCAVGCSSNSPSDGGAASENYDNMEVVDTDQMEPELTFPGESEETASFQEKPSIDETPGLLVEESPEAESKTDFSGYLQETPEPEVFHAQTEGPQMGTLGTYEVKQGETLMKVAFSIYGDIDRWRDLYRLNRDSLRGVRGLRPGIKLQYEVPEKPYVRNTSGESYLIEKGDTLGGIALNLYGKLHKWKKIYKRNQDLIRDPNQIYAGFWLYYDRTPKEIGEADHYHQKLRDVASSVENQAPVEPSSPYQGAY